MSGLIRPVLIGIATGIVVDLVAAWAILEIVDGPEFPY